MSCIRLDGSHRPLPRTARPAELTPAQQLRRRNALWLFATLVGLYDPATDRVRPHTPAELASLFNVSIRTVQMGIAEARKLKELADRA